MNDGASGDEHKNMEQIREFGGGGLGACLLRSTFSMMQIAANWAIFFLSGLMRGGIPPPPWSRL